MKTKVTKTTFLFALLAIVLFGSAVSMVTGWNPFTCIGVIYGLAFLAGYLNKKANRSFEAGVLGDFTISDTTYVGTYETGYFITKATFGLTTVEKGVAFVKDGIKKEHNVGVLTFDNPLQGRNETPSQDPSKKIIITGRTLIPQNIMVYQEVNPRDLEDHFLAEELNKTLLARELPVTVANFMIQYLLNKSFEQIETGIHIGSTTYTGNPGTANANGQIGFFDGLIKKLLVDGTYIPATAPAALTISNIQSQLLDCYKKIPKALLISDNRRKNLRICMSVEDWLLWEEYVTTTLHFKGAQPSDEAAYRYKGIPIVTLAGLPKDTFYIGEFMPDINSNIWIGTNSTEDLQLMFRPLQNNSEKWFMKGLFKFDTQIRLPEEFVMHTTKILADFSL